MEQTKTKMEVDSSSEEESEDDESEDEKVPASKTPKRKVRNLLLIHGMMECNCGMFFFDSVEWHLLILRSSKIELTWHLSLYILM